MCSNDGRDRGWANRPPRFGPPDYAALLAGELGGFSIFSAIVGRIGVISSLHYELAIPLPESDSEGFHVLVLSLLVICSLGAVFLCLIPLIGMRMLSTLNALSLSSCVWLAPVDFEALGAIQVLTMWAIRVDAFNVSAKSKCYQGIGQAVPQVTLGWLWPSALGVVVGQLAGQPTALGVLGKRLMSLNRDDRIIHWSVLKKVASDYRRFPLFWSWSSLINQATTQMPVLLLSCYWGVKAAGFHFLSFRVLQTPMRSAGQAVSQFFFGRRGRQ